MNLSVDTFFVQWDVGHSMHWTRSLSRNFLGSTLPFLGKYFLTANSLKIKKKLSISAVRGSADIGGA
jgi:hypothetical protein